MSDSWPGPDPADQGADPASGPTQHVSASASDPTPTATPPAPASPTGAGDHPGIGAGSTEIPTAAPATTAPDGSSPAPAGAEAPPVAADAEALRDGDDLTSPMPEAAGQPATPREDAEAGAGTLVMALTVERDDEERHHTELRSSRHVTAGVGGASDVGHRHEINQDAYRVELVPAEGRTMAVLVIADGVSSAMNSDIASEQAVAAASRRLVGHLTETPQNTPEDLAEVMAEAFALANLAVIGAPADTAPGSCTLIAGITSPEAISVANVGDSRGYWIGDDGSCVRMSIDDSVAQARIDMGVPREEAETGVHSHAITRWIGPMATDVTPRVLSYTPETSGWLLICSDGLWNYASDPSEIGALVQHATLDTTAELAAQRLVDWALAQGGRDNVTVALARWEHA